MTTVTRMVTLRDLYLEHKFFHNPRVSSGLTDPELETLGLDIKKNGLIDLPKVQRITFNGNESDLVWDGQRRIKAMLKVFGPDHQIEVVDRTEEPIALDSEAGDALLLDALRTTNREGLSSAELAEVAFKLRDRGKSLAVVGAAIGRDASWVSKIMKAREAASPKLLAAWESGSLTDEMFKDLAELTHKEQSHGLESVLAAREAGDASEARTRAKEMSAKAKIDKAAKPEKSAKPEKATNGHNKPTIPPAVGGDQVDMFAKPAPAKPPKKDSPAKAMLEDIVKMAGGRPPTQDYAKGVLAGIRYVMGDLESRELGKPWHQYIDRLAGKMSTKKKATKPVKKAVKRAAPKKKAKKK